MVKKCFQTAAWVGMVTFLFPLLIYAQDQSPIQLLKPQTEGGRPLTGSRWVLLGPLKAYFTNTEGGLAIDESLRVLDNQGQAIPGLYAAGQSGLGGMVLWGHGLHIAWALTSGRLVGEVLGRTEVRT